MHRSRAARRVAAALVDPPRDHDAAAGVHSDVAGPFDLDVVCRSGCRRAQRHDRHRDDQTKAAKLGSRRRHDEVANGSREDHVDSDESEHAATLEEKHSQRLRNLGEAHDVRDDQQRGGEAEPERRDEIDRAEAAVVLADPCSRENESRLVDAGRGRVANRKAPERLRRLVTACFVRAGRLARTGAERGGWVCGAGATTSGTTLERDARRSGRRSCGGLLHRRRSWALGLQERAVPDRVPGAAGPAAGPGPRRPPATLPRRRSPRRAQHSASSSRT